jgi:hypothetical protein
MLALAFAGTAGAQARIDGIAVANGATLQFTAAAGEISIADGGAYQFWGYQDDANTETLVNGPIPQFPGPTLILDQGSTVTIELTSELPFAQCTSIVFPGHAVTAAGGTAGALTQETCPGDAAPVSYTFTASEPGTYMYYAGTQPELQVEMGLLGVIIVRPSGAGFDGNSHAYNHAASAFDHEYLFLLTSMDPNIHIEAEQGNFSGIDFNARWPVYWFINGRTAPDDLANTFVGWLPHQPYNCTPRMTPGQRVLVRIVGGDQDQHPLHLHGNHYYEIARYGRMLLTDGGALASRAQFTTLSVPGQTVDAIFEWTGKDLGWDIYGSPADDMAAHDGIDADLDGYADAGSDYPWEWCADHYDTCVDTSPADGWDDATGERCTNGYTKAFPVQLPENQNLAFGGWWSGSPFMGGGELLPPGEGGLNPNGGFFFMWHSHTEKELTNYDIFPGGMLSMMVVEPPGTPIP